MRKYKYYLEMFGNNKKEIEVPDNLIIRLEGTEPNGYPLCFHLEVAEFDSEYGRGVEGVHPDYLDPAEGDTVEITFTRFREIAGDKLNLVPKEYLPEYDVRYFMHKESDNVEEEDKVKHVYVLMGDSDEFGYTPAYNIFEDSIYTIHWDDIAKDYFEITLSHFERRSEGKEVPVVILDTFAKLG